MRAFFWSPNSAVPLRQLASVLTCFALPLGSWSLEDYIGVHLPNDLSVVG